jgi:cathepsin L
MKVLLALTALIAIGYAVRLSDSEYQNAFAKWMQSHKKFYEHSEFQRRFQIFRSNLDFVVAHNNANKSFTVAMNKFGDLTAEEFGRFYLGTRYTFSGSFSAPSAPTALPVSWNWNTRGAVTPIKNQEQCGSCWAFSTTGSTEGCHYLTKNHLVSLSEQNLMDCSYNQGNQGCDGGLMTQAMQYIISNGGIDTEASYPYTAQDGTCTYSAANRGATLTNYVNVNQGDENDLQVKVHKGPTSVAIDASHSSFQFYSSGVYTEPDCSSTELDHGVLSIGWGTASTGGAYWIVKNSWGTDWGMNGFIWMARNQNNMCGIATMATLPIC